MHRNLIDTAGYKMRRQISTHLQNRAKTIRTAINNYNKAAADLIPPRSQLKASDVLNMVFLAQFDELRYARPGADPSEEPWAKTDKRVLTDKYFELVRAKEEIIRLNVEWRRLRTWLSDERLLYLATINSLQNTNQVVLAFALEERWSKINRAHSIIRYWLRKTRNLEGFSGNTSQGVATVRDIGNPELLRAQALPQSNEDSDQHGSYDAGNDDAEDGGPDTDQLENPDLLSSMIDAMGSISF